MDIDLRSKGGWDQIWGRVQRAWRMFIRGDRDRAADQRALTRVAPVDNTNDGVQPIESVEQRLDALIDRFKR